MFLAFLLARACDTVEWFWQNNRQFAAPTLHQRHSGTRRLRCPATSRSAQLSIFEKMYLLSSTCPVLTFSAALLGQLRFNCPPPRLRASIRPACGGEKRMQKRWRFWCSCKIILSLACSRNRCTTHSQINAGLLAYTWLSLQVTVTGVPCLVKMWFTEGRWSKNCSSDDALEHVVGACTKMAEFRMRQLPEETVLKIRFD